MEVVLVRVKVRPSDDNQQEDNMERQRSVYGWEMGMRTGLRRSVFPTLVWSLWEKAASQGHRIPCPYEASNIHLRLEPSATRIPE